jgi:hypothetical protein
MQIAHRSGTDWQYRALPSQLDFHGDVTTRFNLHFSRDGTLRRAGSDKTWARLQLYRTSENCCSFGRSEGDQSELSKFTRSPQIAVQAH